MTAAGYENASDYEGGKQDWIDAGAKGTFVADCRITSSVRAPWLSEWMQASQAAKAAVAG